MTSKREPQLFDLLMGHWGCHLLKPTDSTFICRAERGAPMKLRVCGRWLHAVFSGDSYADCQMTKSLSAALE
jgi:hypothetical protein